MAAPTNHRTLLITLDVVCLAVSLGKTKIYELIKAGDFPKQVPIPKTRSALWSAKEIEAWVDGLVERKAPLK